MEKVIPGRDKRPMKSHGGETKDVLLTYLPKDQLASMLRSSPRPNGERIRLACGKFWMPWKFEIYLWEANEDL